MAGHHPCIFRIVTIWFSDGKVWNLFGRLIRKALLQSSLKEIHTASDEYFAGIIPECLKGLGIREEMWVTDNYSFSGNLIMILIS